MTQTGKTRKLQTHPQRITKKAKHSGIFNDGAKRSIKKPSLEELDNRKATR